MKFRLVSDIHQEFFLHAKGQDFWTPEPLPDDKDTCLIIAGDYTLAKYDTTKYLLEDLSKQFHTVAYVLGNHEYWKGFLHGAAQKLRDIAEPFDNVHILEDDVLLLEDTMVVGCTLWSDIETKAAAFMYDYRAVRFSKDYTRKINMMDTLTVHHNSVEFIKNMLTAFPHYKRVVVTHFAPSEKSVDDCYAGSDYNSGYFTDLEYLAEIADVWCHGHMHNSSDYMIGDCRVLCNPRGYLREENPEFKEDLVFEV